MAANALAMVFGHGANLPTFANLTAAPAAWVTGALWIGLYGALGVARWEACHVSARACNRSRWATAVLMWAVAYAFVAGAFGPAWTAIHAISLFAVAAIAFIRFAPTSRRGDSPRGASLPRSTKPNGAERRP